MAAEQQGQRAERLGWPRMAAAMIKTRAVYGDIAKDSSVLNGLVALGPKLACATRACGMATTKRCCLGSNNFLLEVQQKFLACLLYTSDAADE